MVLDFIKEYSSYILSAFIIVLDLVIFPILKSKLAKTNKAKALFEVVEKLPDFIIEAEDGYCSGKSKLAYVLQKCHLECLSKNIEFNEELMTSYIEDILETPQKK